MSGVRVLSEATTDAIDFLPDGVHFEDVDWAKFFSDNFSFGYNPKHDFGPFLVDGKYDLTRLQDEQGWQPANITRFMNPDQTPNLGMIFEALESGQQMGYGQIESLTLAVRDPSTLKPADQERLTKGLLNQIVRNVGQFNQIIELLELLYPKFINSFQLIEEGLPKILRRPHVLKTPASISQTFEEDCAHFMAEGYSEDEARELATQMAKYTNSVWMLRKIHKSPYFPLKDDGKKKIDGVRVETRELLEAEDGIVD